MADYRLLRVKLENVEPVVERRIRVDADSTLFDLYLVLVNAMGWNDSHLHLFEVGEDVYSAPVPDIEPMGIDARTVTVREVLPEPGSTITWVYDMGDDWRHEVLVEEVGSADGAVPATVIDGVRACPPDDCGGPFVYAEILELFEDPTYESDHVDSELLGAWFVDGFDPDRFDLSAAQAAVDHPPSLPNWEAMFAEYPDVGARWTREVMAEHKRKLDDWWASQGHAWEAGGVDDG